MKSSFKKPNFGAMVTPQFSNPKSANGPAPVVAHSGNMLEDDLTRDPPKLGVLQQLIYSQEAGKIKRRKLEEMVGLIFEAQKEQLSHRLTLSVDLEKKRDYKDYQLAVNELNKEIICASNDIDDELIEILHDQIAHVIDRRRARIARIEKMNLSQEERATHLERVENWAKLQADQVEGRVWEMLQAASQGLRRTMQLLETESPYQHGNEVG